MYYPFHPLYGREVEVSCRTRRQHDPVTVIAPDGVQLKIPAWMLLPEAARYDLSNQAAISGSAWLRLCDLLGVESVLDTDEENQTEAIDDSHRPSCDDKP